MKRAILIVLFLFYAVNANAQDELSKEHKEVIASFISYFKNNDRQKLAAYVNYPLKREYPIPPVKNKDEFLKRFDEVFDSKLITMIVNSDPLKDWSAVGWRGIMLASGSVWIDYDGTLLTVNYQSDAEIKKKAALIGFEKTNLHLSINKFTNPVCILLTKKYRIRIDEMPNGKYRYVSWKINALMSDKPDLIIPNGEYVPEGSGGNHHYTFKNGKYIYKCGVVFIGEDDSAPAYLTVSKDGNEILNEPATIVTN
ncbi:hypothetical protein ACX0HA_13880 [Flavobacterium hauense]